MQGAERKTPQEPLEIHSVPLGQRWGRVILMVVFMVTALLPPIVVMLCWPSSLVEYAEWLLVLSWALCLSLVVLIIALVIILVEERPAAMGTWRLDNEGIEAFETDGTACTRINWSEFEKGRARNGVIRIRGGNKVITIRDWTIPRRDWKRATNWLSERFWRWEDGTLHHWHEFTILETTPGAKWEFWSTIGTVLILALAAVGGGIFFLIDAANHPLGYLLLCTGIAILAAMLFLRPRNREVGGRWLVNTEQIRYEPRHGSSIVMTWSEIESIKVGEILGLESGGEKLYLSSLAMTESQRKALAQFAVNQLREDFYWGRDVPLSARLFVLIPFPIAIGSLMAFVEWRHFLPPQVAACIVLVILAASVMVLVIGIIRSIAASARADRWRKRRRDELPPSGVTDTADHRNFPR